MTTPREAFEFLRTGRMKFQRYETSDVVIRTPDPGRTIVTGRLRRSRSFGDRAIDDNWRFTKVYERRGDEWKVVSFETSPFPRVQ